jgi:hypothetical protein
MPWKTTMRLGPNAVRLLMTDENQNEILKARLPLRPIHPRSVTTLLEGLSLWAGQPLTAALGAAGRSGPTYAEWLFGPDRWPEDSVLAHFSLLEDRPGRRRTITGVGDFRQLRLLHRDGRSS